MISFDADTHRFNLRAAAVVLHEGAVLLHRIEGDPFWSVPGGRVEPGETAAAAVVRELQEELAETVRCERMLWVVENFFSYRGREHHEVGLYFLAELSPGSRLLAGPGPFMGSEGELALTFEWFDCARLRELDIRPSFLARALASPALPFEHVIHHEQQEIT
jgi:ADP-ribose pyrophosphatase YjhB (NUDIX family)